MSNFSIPALWTKAENKASAVTAAEAIAKPLAIAAVVFPVSYTHLTLPTKA